MNLHALHTAVALLASMTLLGCPGGDVTDDDSAVADDDGGDDDSYVWPAAFGGELTVTSTLGGEAECDAAISMSGAKYDLVCPGCDFAFRVEATLTADNGTAGCWLNPLWSFLPSQGYTDLVLAHAPSWGVEEWYGMYYYHDALITGHALDGEGPYWAVMMHDNSTAGAFTRTGDEVAWTLGYADWVDVDPYWNDCGAIETSDADERFAGAAQVQGTLDCEGRIADAISFDAAAGAELTLSVDTVATDSAFDPAFYVNGPDGCTILQADDSFDCTYPPPAYRCPSARLTTEQGAYRVVVTSRGSCAGDEAGYVLHVDGADGDPSQVSGVVISAERVVDVAAAGSLLDER